MAKKVIKGIEEEPVIRDNNMPLVKHDDPVLEYDTASKAVFQQKKKKKNKSR